MKLPSILILAASALWVCCAGVIAQEQAVLGQGNVPCKSWLENHRNDDVHGAARVAWMLGYITAFNQYESRQELDVSEGKNTEEMTAWMDNYCQQHPAANVYLAVAALVKEFRQRTRR